MSVTISETKHVHDRKSITLVIDYPDYYHNEFTGFFEINILDIDYDADEIGKTLYYDTMHELWDDNKDNRADCTHQFKLVEPVEAK